jgi:type IV pilus assembly protein PilM
MGTHSVKAVQMSRSGGRLCIDEVGYALLDKNAVNADPVAAHAEAVRMALVNMAEKQSYVVAALPGQNVVIRYPRLPDSARDDLDSAVQREAGQNIPYDLNDVSLDWTELHDQGEGADQLKVLLVAAKHESVESRVQILQDAEVDCAVLGVDSLALADAAEGCDLLRVGETVALVNIGLTSASIHFVKDGVSNFIRDVNWGARELIQAIAKERRCDFQEAERILKEATFEAPQAEALAEAEPMAGEYGDIPEAVNGDDVFGNDPFGVPHAAASGGGSLLDPLDEELDGPPARPTVSAPGPLGGGLNDRDLRDTLSAPLTRMVAEIRRSFDYYEHQLYESPVNRLILCGGIAHLPIIGDTLMEELGVEQVEVADPTRSALVLGDNAAMGELLHFPAQFMVAIGLAARGMADL